MAPTALLSPSLTAGRTQGKLSSVPHTLWPFFPHKDIGLYSVYFSAQFTLCFKVEWVRLILRPFAHTGLGRGDLWLRTILAVVVWRHLLATAPTVFSNS